MAIDRVTISFNSRPDLKIRGQKVDIDNPGTFKIGDKTYKGIRLDQHTVLHIRPGNKGKYDLDLISTGHHSLDKWNAKLSGGQVQQIKSRGIKYTARKNAKLPDGKLNFKENSEFARKFRQNATTLVGHKLRQAGFQITAPEIYKLRRSGHLTNVFVNTLLHDQKAPLEQRKGLLQAALNGNLAAPNQQPGIIKKGDASQPPPTIYRQRPPNMNNLSGDNNINQVPEYDREMASSLVKVNIELKEEENNITLDQQTRSILQKTIEQKTAQRIQPNSPYTKNNQALNVLVAEITEQVFNDHLQQNLVPNPIADDTSPVLNQPPPKPIQNAQQFIQDVEQVKDNLNEMQQQRSAKRDQHIKQQAQKRQNLKVRRYSNVNTQNDLKTINLIQGQLYLNRVEQQGKFGALLKQARAQDNKDLLGDRTGFPPENPLAPPSVTKKGAEKAILAKFEEHQGTLSPMNDADKDKIAIQALSDYIALPPDPPKNED